MLQEYKQRASGGGNLLGSLVGEITETQLKRIEELETKQNTVKGLTDNQSKELKKLNDLSLLTPNQEKKKAELEIKKTLKTKLTDKEVETLKELKSKLDNQDSLELAETAKSYIIEQWLKNEIGYVQELKSDAIRKGILCEDESIGLLNELTESNYFKNELSFSNDYFTGTPDILTPELVIDIKTSLHPASFMKAHLSRLYITQLQIYMYLTGVRKARLVYVLANSPKYIVDREIRYCKNGFIESFGSQAEWSLKTVNKYKEEVSQIKLNHTFGRLPLESRIKTFDVEYSPALIQKLKTRIDMAREFYKTIKL
jgi:hypothetical protein